MKLVVAVIRPSKLDGVVEALSSVGVSGFTITEARGLGRQESHVQLYQGADFEATSVPIVEIDAAIPDQLLGKVIAVLEKAARTGKVGDGKIFVSALERAVRVRTGETNDAAL